MSSAGGDGLGSSVPPTATNESLFSKASPRTDDEIAANKVVVPKGRRGEPGSDTKRKNYLAATAALASRFGAMKHLVANSQTGESDTANESKYASIQETFCSNSLKLKKLNERILKFDLKDILMIAALQNPEGTHAKFRWGGDNTKIYILEHMTDVALEVIILWQKDINLYSDCDAESSEWLNDLLVNSCSDELNLRIDEKLSLLPDIEQGGIVRLKLMLDEMFFMSEDVVTALQHWFENFATIGPSKTAGENISVLMQQVTSCAERLAAVGQLPLDTPTHVLSGLTKCTVEEFKKPFDLMLNQERLIQLGTGVTIGGDCGPTLVKIRNIAKLANTSYHSRCMSGGWNVPTTGLNPCFNCDDPNHGVGNCPHQKDQKKIAENKKKFIEAKKAKQGSGGGGDGGKTWPGRKRGNSSNKSGKGDKKGKTSGSKGGSENGVHLVDGRWMCLCKKGCGFNLTHTTGFHEAWSQNTAGFSLPATHVFVKKQREAGITQGPAQSQGPPSLGGTTPQGQSQAIVPAGAAVGGFSQMGASFASQHSVQTKAVLEHHKNTVSDPELSSFLADLQKAWNLN